MSLLVREKVFVGAVSGLDLDAKGQEHKQQGVDEKKATQGLVRIKDFTVFPPQLKKITFS